MCKKAVAYGAEESMYQGIVAMLSKKKFCSNHIVCQVCCAAEALKAAHTRAKNIMVIGG
jgi:hypothetical protein